jgi:spore coat assembly protein SafA
MALVYDDKMQAPKKKGALAKTGAKKKLAKLKPGAAKKVVVKPGDTLSEIARKNGVPLQQLIAANPQFKNPNLIYPGNVVNVPAVTGPIVIGARPLAQAASQMGSPSILSSGAMTSRAGSGPRAGMPAPAQVRPSGGITNTNAARPVDASVRGDPSNRNRNRYEEVIRQFGVASNPRYAQRDSNKDGTTDTFCNIYVWDVSKAMGAEIPHWVDGKSAPAEPGAKGAWEMNANATVDWLKNHGGENGWRQVTADEAQARANDGNPTVAVWKNPGGIGHVGMIRPGEVTEKGPALAQAGATNFDDKQVQDGFGGRTPQYWTHD